MQFSSFDWCIKKNVCECLNKVLLISAEYCSFVQARIKVKRVLTPPPQPLGKFKVNSFTYIKVTKKRSQTPPPFPSKQNYFLNTPPGGGDSGSAHLTLFCQLLTRKNVNCKYCQKKKTRSGHFRLFRVFENRFLFLRNEICIRKRACFHTV